MEVSTLFQISHTVLRFYFSGLILKTLMIQTNVKSFSENNIIISLICNRSVVKVQFLSLFVSIKICVSFNQACKNVYFPASKSDPPPNMAYYRMYFFYCVSQNNIVFLSALKEQIYLTISPVRRPKKKHNNNINI